MTPNCAVNLKTQLLHRKQDKYFGHGVWKSVHLRLGQFHFAIHGREKIKFPDGAIRATRKEPAHTACCARRENAARMHRQHLVSSSLQSYITSV